MKAVHWEKLSTKEAAAAVCSHLKRRGIDALLVGGACVTIYSSNKYESYDFDFVSFRAMPEIQEALKEIGFLKVPEGHFEHPKCRYSVEFVSPPAAVGSQIIKRSQVLKTAFGQLKLFTPTDSVKDRLAAYLHWHDHQSLNQALMIARQQKVSFADLKKWAAGEGGPEVFEEFKKALSVPATKRKAKK